MTKICSIVPQILHNGNLENSLAFSQLWEKAKIAFTDSVEARENAKAEYASYFTSEFRRNYGDWILYRNIKEGIATDQDFITLANIYTDLAGLEKTIKIELNEQYEPVKSSIIKYRNYFKWARYSENNYEVSSQGDKRFSAFYAQLNDGRYIEDIYQLDIKGNGIAIPKPITDRQNPIRSNIKKTGNFSRNISREESWEEYKSLWRQYLNENPNLLNYLINNASGKVLTDKFANTDVSQARALAEILNERNNKSIEEYKQLSLFNNMDINSYTHVKSIYIPNINSEYLPSKDHLILNRVISAIIVSSLDDLQNLKLIDLVNNETVKDKVIDSLNEIYNSNSNKALKNVIDDIKNDNHHVWELAVGYLNNKFNIRLKDTSDFEEELNISDDFDLKDFKEGLDTKSEIPHNWDDSQLNVDLVKTTAYEIQLELSKSVYKNTVKDIINPNNNSEENSSNIYGLNMPLDIDDIWGQILSVNATSINKADIIKNIKLLSKFNFNDALSDFINKLETNNEFYNLFYRTANLAIVDNETIIVDKDLDIKSKNTFSYITNNRNAKAENVAYNTYLNNINSRVISSSHNLQDILSEINNYSNNTNMLIKFNSILKLSNLLGIGISKNSLASYLDKYYTGIPFDVFYSELKNLSLDEKMTINDLSNELFDKLLNITSGIFNSYGYNFENILKNPKYAAKAVAVKNKRLRLNETQKGTLRTLARISRIDFANKTAMSYYNAEFNREQAPQYNSFITDLFDVISNESATEEDIIKALYIYTQDPRLDYDNLLWDDSKKGNIGIFRYNMNGDKKVVRSINKTAIKLLRLSQFSGVRSSGNGQHYTDIKDDNWNLIVAVSALNNKYLIPTSDSGRSYAIDREFERFDAQLEKHLDEFGSIDLDSFDVVDSIKETRLYSYIMNNILQEFKDIQLTFSKLYDVDAYISDNGSKLKVNKQYSSQKARKSLLNKIECKINEKTGKIDLITDGKPSGNVFNISNLSYIKDGKSHTLASMFETYEYDYLRRVLTSDLNNLDTSTTTIIDKFIGEWLFYNQDKTINDLGYIRKEIINAESKYESFKGETETGEVIKSKSLVPNNENLEGEDLEDWKFNVTALNLFLNHHFNSVIFGNLLVGNANEFKNMVDFNKRNNQPIRNGVSTSEDVPYRMLVMDNIELPSEMIDLFVEHHNGTVKELEEVKKRYNKLIDTTNAIDIITDNELIKRLKSFGVYDRYKDYIDAINAKNDDGTFKPLNPEIYTYLLEQMKFFSYSRELRGDRVVSVQNKNSTIILFERFVRGTDKENLYNFMKKFNIDDINTSEGHKLGGGIPLKLHNDDGTFNTSLLDTDESNILPHVLTLSHKNLRIQQEIVPHLKNETNRWATQMLKKTFDNIIDTIDYKIGSNSIKGRTGSIKDGERGIFEDFHLSLSYNAQDSMYELLNEFGAIENGQVKMSPDGLSIQVDVNKIGNIIQRYFIENSTDLNIIKAVSMTNGKANLPYHHPSLIKLIENVLEAKITNKITRQKVKGSHVPIQPDMFNTPIKGVKESTNQDTWVTYSKEYLKDCSSDERGNRKLRSEYVDSKGVFHPAEIVLNPFDKRFYQEKYLMDDGSGRVDINKIPREERLVFGTRIPHEGYQSSFVAEIVGFFQDGSSTGITPDHLIYRTGWDFDIDSIYLYHKEVNGAGEVFDINDNSEAAVNRRLDNYIKLRYPEQYNSYLKQIRKENSDLYSQLKSVYAATDKFIISNPDYIQAVKNLEKKIGRAEKAITLYEMGNNNMTEAEYNKKVITYNNDISKLLKLRLSNTEVNAIKNSIVGTNLPQLKAIAKSFKYHYDIGNAIKDRIIKTKAIAEQIRLNKDKVSVYTKFKESKRSEFNKLDKIEQAIRQERNNHIIDLLISIHSDPHTFINREKPNEYSHIASASDYVNAQLGFSNKNAHITNITDQMYFRNLNMNVATLKENSVAYDNILAILRTLGAYNQNNKVSAVMKLTEVKGYNPNDTINTIYLKFNEIFGEKNFEIRGDKVYIKNIGYIANNVSRNGKDIQGQFITEQRSELTSNILDAVKQLMVNLNQDTFAIFAYLCSTPLSYYTNIHTKGESEVNRYIYPSLFISQPIIQELTRSVVLNNRFGDKQFSSYSFNTIKENYYSKVLNILTNKSEYDIESFILDQRANFIGTSERHEENTKSKYNDALNDLLEYNKAKNNDKNKYVGKNLKWAINKYLESNSLNTIESRPYTLEELDNNIKNNVKGNNNSLNYLVDQLSILEYYNDVDKASTDITSLMSVLNTDKLGASPTSNTSNKLFNNIVKIANSYDGFVKYIKETEYDSKSIIKRVEDSLYSKVSLKEKQDFITSVYDHYGYTASPSLKTPGGNVIEDVYGEFLKSDNPDFRKSKYMYLQAQAYFTNLLSTKVYNTTILAENHEVKALLNKTLSELNSINDERVRYKFLNYFLNNNLMREVDFFANTDYNKIISAVEIVETETPYEGKIIYRKEVKQPDFVSKEVVLAAINPIDTFNNLSLANQILILKQMSNNILLDIISPKLDKESYESNGYVELSIIDVDRNIDTFRAAFTRMFNSNNEYERIVARNLIKYAYITNGLQFGSSISKYIDIEAYYNPKFSEYEDNDLYKSSDALYNIDLLPTKGLNDEYFTNIHKANWDNIKINPIMEASIYKDNKGRPRINTTLPTWRTTGKDVAETTHELIYAVEHLIFEKAAKINDSKFANYDFLAKEYDFKGNTVKVLYKRFSQEVGGYYIYYPINKTLPYEYGKSSVPFNYLIPVNNRNNVILDESTYLEVIMELSIKKGKIEASTSTNVSYMNNIKRLHDESDISIYVEDKSHPQNKIARSVLSNTKSIIITESELKSSLVNLNNKIKSKLTKETNTAFIFGSYSELSAEILNENIGRIIKNNTINKVTSIILPETDVLMDVGKVILKSDSISNKDVTSLDQNAVSFDQVEYGESSSEAIVYSVMEQIKNAEEDVLTTLNRLNKQLENTNVENRKVIENVVNRSRDILDNIDPTLPSMDAISDVILSNKIVYDFLNKQIDNLFKNMTSANLVKFTNPEYYEDRVQFSKDLDLLKNYITAANQLLNMPYFSFKQIANVEPEDAEIIDSYNNAVRVLHEQRDDLKLTEQALYDFIKKYESIHIISKSRNAAYPETIYNRAIEYLKEQGHNIDDINLRKITDEDFASVIDRMLKNNEDISYFSSILDSARDTGVTLVDVMGKVYADVLYRTNTDSLEKKVKFDKLLSKVYKDTGKEYNASRESWFKSRFIDKNGDLITEYNYKDYQAKIYALNEVLNTHIARRRDAINRRDRDAVKIMNAEIKKQRELIDKARNSVEIKRGSEEYEIYKEAYYSLPERSRKAFQINNMITIIQSDKGIRIFKHSPTDEYKNKEYSLLTNEEQEFLSELRVMLHHYIADVFPTYEVSNSFVPYSFNPKFNFKKFFTLPKSKQDKFFIDLNNNVQYYLDATMLHAPTVKDLINIPKEGTDQDKLNKINESSEEKFKTLSDVYEYNKQLREASKIDLKDKRNYDIGNLMHNLLNQLNDVKITKDFESDYRLTLTVLSSDEFQANYKSLAGKNVMDKVKSFITQKHEVIKKYGKENRVYDRYKNHSKALYNVGKINTNLESAMHMVLRLTSISTMGFNGRANIKNVIVGYTTMMVEAISKEFMEGSHLRSAANQYRSAFISILKDADKDTSDNFTSAYIKHFHMIFADPTDRMKEQSVDAVSKVARYWETAAYIGLNGGEHFMQFNTLLAMSKSHRVVGGIAMSLSDYINDRRLSIVEPHLSKELFSELKNYIYDESHKETNATNYVDYINKFLDKNYSKISNESKTAIKDSIKDTYNSLKQEFESFETVEDQFELKDGYIKVKNPDTFGKDRIAEFADRVRKVNHSMHGIYNLIDINQLQDSMLGELLMQFRKWQRLTFVRWFSARYGKTTFSEGTGTYRAGAFHDFWRFIGTPIVRESFSKVPVLEAISNLAKGYIEYLQNISYYYNKLPSHQKANVMRAIAQISSLCIASVLLYAAYAAMGSDDDDKKKALQNWWVANTVYQLSAIQSEIFDTTRLGWIPQYKRTRRNFMASERAMTDLASFLYYSMIYPFQDDKHRYYQRGIYKDESKAMVHLEKSIPLVRQLQVGSHLSNTISFYQMYNPIYNLIPNN